MARRGMKPRLDLESRYGALIWSGVGTVEACRIVGIGRKTGYRWRAENGGVPPALVAEEARSGRYLSTLERQRIGSARYALDALVRTMVANRGNTERYDRQLVGDSGITRE